MQTIQSRRTISQNPNQTWPTSTRHRSATSRDSVKIPSRLALVLATARDFLDLATAILISVIAAYFLTICAGGL